MGRTENGPRYLDQGPFSIVRRVGYLPFLSDFLSDFDFLSLAIANSVERVG